MLAFFFLTGAAWAGRDKAEQDKVDLSLRLVLDLVDGSRVIGIPDVQSVPIHTSYAKMDLSLEEIRSVTIGADHEAASVDLQNGDKIRGVVSLKPIKLQTIFGKVSVGAEHIREIYVMRGVGAIAAALEGRLILYYSFDVEEESRARDGSTKKNDGQVFGAKWTPKGIRGGAYQFDGSNDYIDSMSTSLANGLGEVTLSAWACSFASSPHAGIATACSSNSRDLLMLSEGYPGKRQATFYVGNGARYDGVSAVPPGVFAPGAWHHLAGTWKSPESGGDGLLRMYFDGALSSTSAAPLDGRIAQTTSLKIGWDDATHASPENRRFNGLIDEVMLFDKAMTEQEVRQIYDAQKVPAVEVTPP